MVRKLSAIALDDISRISIYRTEPLYCMIHIIMFLYLAATGTSTRECKKCANVGLSGRLSSLALLSKRWNTSTK